MSFTFSRALVLLTNINLVWISRFDQSTDGRREERQRTKVLGKYMESFGWKIDGRAATRFCHLGRLSMSTTMHTNTRQIFAPRKARCTTSSDWKDTPGSNWNKIDSPQSSSSTSRLHSTPCGTMDWYTNCTIFVCHSIWSDTSLPF